MNKGFNYVNCVGCGCEGWLNLFFDDDIICLVNDTHKADKIRKETPKRKALEETYKEVQEAAFHAQLP